jgi:hypothetical protein
MMTPSAVLPVCARNAVWTSGSSQRRRQYDLWLKKKRQREAKEGSQEERRNKENTDEKCQYLSPLNTDN